MRLLPPMVLAGCLAAADAMAEAVPDRGFSVEAPAGWSIVEKETVLDHYSPADVVGPGGTPLCAIGLFDRMDAENWGTAEPYAIVGIGEWRRRLTTKLGEGYRVDWVRPFAVADRSGAVAFAVLTEPLDGREEAAMLYALDSPRYRLTLFCTASERDLIKRRLEIDALARGITPPG